MRGKGWMRGEGWDKKGGFKILILRLKGRQCTVIIEVNVLTR